MQIAKAFTFSQMPPGRHAFALSQIASLAHDAELPQTAARAERALAQAHVALELEQRWLTTLDTHKLKIRLNKEISALQKTLHADAQGNTKDPHAGMANAVIERLFPRSIHHSTYLIIELEQGEVDILLGRLDREFSHLVEMLNIGGQIERIRTANAELRARRLNRADVTAAQKRLHAETCKTVATLFLELDGDDPQTLAKHTEILAPFVDQQHQVSLFKGHKVTDIDPKTGDELLHS